MADPIRHRGPDGLGFFDSGPLGLGILRLQTGDILEPVEFAISSNSVIAADARIDNREELLEELGLGSGPSYSRIMAEAHSRWGSDAPGHFLGPFGYAIWDLDAH
jgi:asparagine synthase (glutamine-hydrolysing)